MTHRDGTPIVDRETVVDTHRMRVERLTLDVGGGRTRQRHLVVHPGAVVALPLLADGSVVLIRNYRVSTGSFQWELPAGTVEPNETDLVAAARREVEEETGYRAETVRPLMGFYPAPGSTTEYMHVFVCTNLVETAQRLDDVERITVHPTPFDEAIGMVADGTIQNGATIATLLWFDRFGRRLPR